MQRSKLDIILNMIKTGRGGQESTAALKDVDKAQDAAEDSSKKFSLAQLGLATALTGVTLAAIKQLPELFDLGFSYKNAQIALAAYSGSAEEAEKLTQAVTEAAGGAIDQMTAMQNATRLLSLGLAENAQEASELTRIAITLGATMGKDATQAFEEFTLLLANQSILRLDTFGISAGLVRQRMEELAQEMPEVDRQTRFLNATLEIARGRMEQLDEAGFEATSSLDVLRAKAADLKVGVSTLVFEALEPLIDSTLLLLEGNKPLTDAIIEQLQAMADQGATAEELNTEIARLAFLTGLTVPEVRKLAEAAGVATIATSQLALAMRGASLASGGLGTELSEEEQILFDFLLAMQQGSEATEELESNVISISSAFGELNEKLVVTTLASSLTDEQARILALDLGILNERTFNALQSFQDLADSAGDSAEVFRDEVSPEIQRILDLLSLVPDQINVKILVTLTEETISGIGVENFVPPPTTTTTTPSGATTPPAGAGGPQGPLDVAPGVNNVFNINVGNEVDEARLVNILERTTGG